MRTLRSFLLLSVLPFAVACSATTAEDDADAEDALSRHGHDAGHADAAVPADAASTSPSTFVDPRDGQSYPTIKIGSATWLARNLSFASEGTSFCYGDKPSNCLEHGRLYLWSVARSVCPAGWRLPTDADWKHVETALGMPASDLGLEGYDTPRGTDEGTQLKDPNGFGARMSGFRTGSSYDALGDRTYFWTATTRGTEVWRRRVAASEPTVFRFTNPPDTFAISVRCVKN